MSPIQAITTCLRKSFQFSGRASRPEFWWFTLAYIATAPAILYLLDVKLYGVDFDDPLTLAPFTETFTLLTLPATLSVTLRRINDIGAPGWVAMSIVAASFALSYGVQFFDLIDRPWFFNLYMAVLILNLFVLIFAIRPSSPTPNRYGPNPKGF